MRNEIARELHSFSEETYIQDCGDYFAAEYGGNLPRRLVALLRQLGADVREYKHRGVVSTVVSF